jgi:hypothetical protein
MHDLRNEAATLEAEAAGREGALALEARWAGEQAALFGFRTDPRYHAYTTPPADRVSAESSVARSGAAFLAGVRGEAVSVDGDRCDHFSARDAIKGAGARPGPGPAAPPRPAEAAGGWSFLEHEAPRLGEKKWSA